MKVKSTVGSDVDSNYTVIIRHNIGGDELLIEWMNTQGELNEVRLSNVKNIEFQIKE